MELSELFARFEVEFELELPEDAEQRLLTVSDVRDCIRKDYRRQGIEISAGAVFDRLRQIIAILTRTDATDIEPETRLADLVPERPSHAA